MADIVLPTPFSRANWPSSRLLPAKIRRLVSPELLLGGRGGGFPVLHFDTRHLHAFVAQIFGSKEFILFPPDQTPFLYPIDGSPNKSAIDRVFDPDISRFPLLERAQSVRVTLGPGETIFVPAGWWHTTSLPETSISVTWNLANASNWREFVVDSCAQWGSKRSPALTRLFGFYLQGVGRLQRHAH